MPGFNGMGPQGDGPRTGGGFGYCSPARTGRNDAGYGVGRGGKPYGGGRGRCFGGRGEGRGYGFQAWGAQPRPEENGDSVNEKLDFLMQQMEMIEREISELRRNAGEK